MTERLANAEGGGVGFLSDRKARREAAEAKAAAEREASAREAGLSAEELVGEWRELLGANGVDTTDIRSVVDASGGCVFRPSLESAMTSVERGVVIVTGSGDLVLAFRAFSPGGGAPRPIEVIVRSISEVREPRKKGDRSFFIVFERDRLFRPPNNPSTGDAWELRHSDPDELHRHFSSVGLPW
jgi:hypothetical protein